MEAGEGAGCGVGCGASHRASHRVLHRAPRRRRSPPALSLPWQVAEPPAPALPSPTSAGPRAGERCGARCGGRGAGPRGRRDSSLSGCRSAVEGGGGRSRVRQRRSASGAREVGGGSRGTGCSGRVTHRARSAPALRAPDPRGTHQTRTAAPEPTACAGPPWHALDPCLACQTHLLCTLSRTANPPGPPPHPPVLLHSPGP